MRNGLILLVILAAGYYGLFPDQRGVPDVTSERSTSSVEEKLEDAIRQRASDVQLKAVGHVIRLLPDDRDGSRHQRFIIKTGTGRTILVAHNIDLAPRVNGIAVDDRVEIYGEYEWNDKGGVIHWTHHDPKGRHQDGWIRHKGKLYQ